MEAFGSPGRRPTWAQSAKDGIGTAIGNDSKVWFTLWRGVVTEVYYPTIDTADVKDLRFIVVDDEGNLEEEGIDTTSEIDFISMKAPAYLIRNTSNKGLYSINKRVLTDPAANTLIIRTSFEALKGVTPDYRLFVVLNPHIKNRGAENYGWCADYGNKTYLFASRDSLTIALTSSVGFKKMSAGYLGTSDSLIDIRDHKDMQWEFERAGEGNIALCAELPIERDATLVLGFGRDNVEAALETEKTLGRHYHAIESEYVRGWKGYVNGLEELGRYSSDGGKRYLSSAIVLKASEDKQTRGCVIASLSVPWGEQKGDGESVGYHLVSPRDLVKSAFAFLAMGDEQTAIDTLRFLKKTQRKEGFWPRSMWLDGNAYDDVIELDEVALPIILAWRLRKTDFVGDEFYPMALRCAEHIASHGPVIDKEQWESGRGFSAATMASLIAALVCFAAWAVEREEQKEADSALSLADFWTRHIDEWCFVECDCLKLGLRGHYLRIAKDTPTSLPAKEEQYHAEVFMSSLPEGTPHGRREVIDTGFLDLVRYGVKAPDDWHIISSLKLADALLRRKTRAGTAFKRYLSDGYGEGADGSPFSGTGIGRAWPLLSGERAMYEVIAGNGAADYLESMENFSNEGLLFPEQVWDAEDIPSRGLYNGRATGSATPLTWAHAEYILVLRSIRDDRGFELVEEVRQRYINGAPGVDMSIWMPDREIKSVSLNTRLRILCHEPATLVWSDDAWHSKHSTKMKEAGLGLYLAEFKPREFKAKTRLCFTFFYSKGERWEGRDFDIEIT